MKLTIEYLVIFTQTDSFCDSVEAFNKLLQIDSAIVIEEGKLHYSKQNFNCGYRITGDEITGKDQRYYHLEFTLKSSSNTANDDIAIFMGLLKIVRGIISRIGGQIETLWDDVSFYYAQQAYPIIFEIESLMRKLIANFMLITIGKEWISETSPKEVKDAISKSKRKDYANILHTIDFIDLISFMTKAYSPKSADDIYKGLKQANSIEDLTILKGIIPQSNWQRYFSKIVECDDTYIQARWEELYELRCKVAHNAIISKVEYERIAELANDLRIILQEAINKLPQVSVPRDEREQVAEDAVKNVNDLYGSFLVHWKILENEIARSIPVLNGTPSITRKNIEYLKLTNQLPNKRYKELLDLVAVRNNIVHSTNHDYSESEIREYIETITKITNALRFVRDSRAGNDDEYRDAK